MEPAAVDQAPAGPARTATSTMLAGVILIAVAVVFLWYAPDSYNVYKALHVTAILIWVGGDLTLTTLGIVFERRRDGSALAELGKMGAWIGTRVYTPALFAAFAFGVALIQKGGLGWGAFWIDFAIAGWAVAACGRHRLRRPGARPDRQGRAAVRPRLGGGGASREAAVHDLPLRHGAARVDRDRHDGEAVQLNSRSGPERKSLPSGGLFRLTA